MCVVVLKKVIYLTSDFPLKIVRNDYSSFASSPILSLAVHIGNENFLMYCIIVSSVDQCFGK